MNNVFIKKYWEEDDILFYIHFYNGMAIRQIEVKSNSKLFFSIENYKDRFMICDQPLECLEIYSNDYITEEEFNMIWVEK